MERGLHISHEGWHDCIVVIDLAITMAHELDVARPNKSIPYSRVYEHVFVTRHQHVLNTLLFTTSTGYS